MRTHEPLSTDQVRTVMSKEELKRNLSRSFSAGPPLPLPDCLVVAAGVEQPVLERERESRARAEGESVRVSATRPTRLSVALLSRTEAVQAYIDAVQA
eukprot:3909811-Rhodomonas_salina.1